MFMHHAIMCVKNAQLYNKETFTMKLSTNVIRFHPEFDIYKALDIFAEAGFDAVDFNEDLKGYYTGDHDKDFYLKVKEYAKSKGITFDQAHAPFPSSYEDEEKTKARFDDIVRSFYHCAWLGTDIVVVHSCTHIEYKPEENRDMLMQMNLDFYRRLIPYAKDAGIRIAIENTGGVTKNAEDLIELFDTLNDPVFTVCFDVGHAHMHGHDPAEMIRKLGKRIGCTHVHDNNGTADQHTLPYSGLIDWESVMKALADVEYGGNLSYEAGYFIRTTPNEVKEDAAKYMASVGHHLIGRYNYYRGI